MKVPDAALVTGASGFLGRHLIQELLKRGRYVIAATRNPSQLTDLNHQRLKLILVQWDQINHLNPLFSEDLSIFHLAAQRAHLGTSVDDYRRVNVDATLQLAHAAVEARVFKFVYISTALIFGPSEGTPLSENTQNIERGNLYLDSKIEAMKRLDPLIAQGLPLITICPTIIYGPDHPSHPNRITDQIRRLLRTRVDLVVNGGHQVRDLVYVDDVVNGILNAETHPINGEVFILSGEGISHRAFNELVLALRGLQPRIKLSIPLFLAAFFSRQMDRIQGHKHRYGYTDALGMLTQEWQFNSSKAAQVLSYKPRPLEVGFKSMLNWLRT